MYKDPYQVLGLSSDATSEEVKKKYRTLVKQYHPDLHPDDAEAAEKMSEINAAYERINSGDVYNSNNYSQSSSGSYTAPSGSYTDNGTTYYYRYSNMEDIFRTFFGDFDFSDFSSRQDTSEAYQRIEMYLSQ
ncbi:MAG: DnaJ domain-containing protein, partial [Huintestinicola sp.]